MLFMVFRFVFWGLAFLACFIWIQRSHSIYKHKRSILAFIIAVIFMIVSAFLPIENAFVTFSSPQSAFHYNHPGDIKLILDGEKTNFVIGERNDNVFVYSIVPKVGNGWKLGMGLDTKMIIRTLSDGISIHVYRYKNSDDYYIEVLTMNGGSLEITDNRGSQFQSLDRHNDILIYYTYINSYNDQYTLTVNGKKISLPH